MQEDNRTCRTCKRTMPVTHFHLNKVERSRAYYTARCRKCIALENRTAYHSDPEFRALQVMRSMENWVKNRYPEALTRSIVKAGAVKLLDATECTYCGTPNDGKWTFSLDHHTPLSLGGTHSLDNLTPCCEPCNRAKHDMPPTEFTQWMQELIQRHRYN